MPHNPKMFYLIRAIHGVITVIFLSCIGYIYYSGITDQINSFTYITVGLIAFESIVIVLNQGDCPLGGIHRKYGDDKAFFELFLSKRLAKLAVPVLGLVAGLGIVLLFL